MGPIDRHQLRAFETVVRAGSFTRAAAELHLSQPALSRRVANLEEHFEAVLLERRRARVMLTPAGRQVFAFAEAQRTLEEELGAELAPSGEPRGVVRLAGLSSLVPPVVLPALAPFLRANPGVQIELFNIETSQLGRELAEGGVDMAISDLAGDVAGIVDEHLGDEEYVMMESRKHPGRHDVFLDTSPQDRVTELFFAAQPARLRPASYQRSFLHDEPGILLGVELGLGRAVKPSHTASAAVRIDERYRPLRKPVYLLTRKQRYVGRLQRAVRELVVEAVRGMVRPPLTDRPAGARGARGRTRSSPA
jgi:DNA-binding transcriptional LysR family regulator